MTDDPLGRLLESYEYDFNRLEADLAARKRSHREQLASERLDNAGPVVVSAQDIEKTYRSGKNSVAAVQGVSFNIHAGEIVAITGPSGSGKSTVLNLLSGLDRPDAGTISIDGTDITKLNRNRMAEFRCQHIGFVFQFFYLQPFLTLQKNVQVPAMFLRSGHSTKSERDERANRLISSVGLADRVHHLPKELSGGQMQRAAIARALINEPKLVLADEPTGNLDSQNAQGIMELFFEVRDTLNTAIVIVTHDQKIASQADRVIELIDGKVA